jgi:hypothetical protein
MLSTLQGDGNFSVGFFLQQLARVEPLVSLTIYFLSLESSTEFSFSQLRVRDLPVGLDVGAQAVDIHLLCTPYFGLSHMSANSHEFFVRKAFKFRMAMAMETQHAFHRTMVRARVT